MNAIVEVTYDHEAAFVAVRNNAGEVLARECALLHTHKGDWKATRDAAVEAGIAAARASLGKPAPKRETFEVVL